MTQDKWRVDKHIPVAMLLALFMQTAGIVWWAASLEARVGVLEQWMKQNTMVIERMGRVEERVEGLKEQAMRIEVKLDRAMGK